MSAVSSMNCHQLGEARYLQYYIVKNYVVSMYKGRQLAKILYIVSPVYDGIKHIKRRIEASYEVFFSLISFYRCFVCAPSKLQLLYIYLMFILNL